MSLKFVDIDFNKLSAKEVCEFGYEFLDNGDIDGGIKCLIHAAEQEYAEAQFCLGDIYRFGYVVKKNLDEAVKWYSLAAKNGDCFAQYELGDMYQEGNDVDQNEDEAQKLFGMAARNFFNKKRFNQLIKRSRPPYNGPKYKFILEFQDCCGNEEEIHSDEIDGKYFSPWDRTRINGVFYSYEEAQEALENFLVLKVIVTRNHNDGDEWIEEIDSFDDDYYEHLCFFSYRDAESWAYSEIEDDDYEDDDYEDDDYEDGGKESIKSTYEIVELEAISSKIVEIYETSEA